MHHHRHTGTDLAHFAAAAPRYLETAGGAAANLTWTSAALSLFHSAALAGASSHSSAPLPSCHLGTITGAPLPFFHSWATWVGLARSVAGEKHECRQERAA
jgi:hypothetical protein